MTSSELVFSVSEFVALLNQTLDYAYPNVTVCGELANFKVSKNRWVYFDLKDSEATVRFFGTVYQLPGPLEDGMMMAVKGSPRLHPQYGFSITVQSMVPMGEGSIKKAAKLLEAKLAAEGLFDIERKRPLPYPPTRIGLVTSIESAAYKDFLKVISARWGGLNITLIDIQVQGETAPAQIVAAIEKFNQLALPPEVLVITRGGGSAEDLQAFSTEQVTRAVASSRIPTVVAVGHEIDVSLAELAADQRASTPSNAAELLVPDRKALLVDLYSKRSRLISYANTSLEEAYSELEAVQRDIGASVQRILLQAKQRLALHSQIIKAFDPQAALSRGYALVRNNHGYVYSGRSVGQGDNLDIQLADANLTTTVKRITMLKGK